jgi:hypothetical protein
VGGERSDAMDWLKKLLIVGNGLALAILALA